MTNNDPLLQAGAKFPKHLVVQTANGELKWTRRPESGTEQLYHFVFHLRMVMMKLAAEPIGKKTSSSPAAVAKMLTSLPKRAAFVRSGDTVGVIYTHDTQPPLPNHELYGRAKDILEHTRMVYCHPKAEVERSFSQNTGNAGTSNVQPVSRWEEIE